MNNTFVMPRVMVRGLGSGAMIMTFFGAYWTFAAVSFALQGSGQIILITALSIVSVITIALFALCILLFRASRTLPTQQTSPEDAAYWKGTGWRFGLVLGIEIVAIALANVILDALHHDEFIPPAIALIVGVHFFPLATLFKVPIYHLTGAAMTLIAIIAIIALLFHVPIGAGSSSYNWSIVVSFACGLILWATAIYILTTARRLLRLSKQHTVPA